MKVLLIYKTKTGFTEKYANWIKEELDCDIKKISDISKIDFDLYDLIIFGTRIHAGMIDGLNTIRKYNIMNKLVIFITGATPKETDTIKEVWKNNMTLEELNSIKHFYFPAGLNYERMGFIDRTIMKLLSKMLSNKESKNAEEIGTSQAITSSYDNSDKKWIKPLVEYIKKK